MYTPEVLERSRNAEATFWEVPFGFASDKAIVEGSVLTWDFKL